MPYMLNGELLDVATEPRLQDGTMWVPLRKLATALGGNVDWESSNDVAILYLGDRVATIQAGQTAADVDGSAYQLQAAPFEEGGETWVPVRFFEDALGYTLTADPNNGIVDLSRSV